MKKVCCQLSHFSHTQERGDPCRQKPCREIQKETIRILCERQEGKFSLKSDLRSTSTNFKSILIGEVFRNWMELSNLSEEKMIMLLQAMNNFDEINYFCMNDCWNKIGIFVKLIWKVWMKRKSWSNFKGQDLMTFWKEDWSKMKDTIHEFTARIQELQKEVNCMNDSRDFKDAESVRSGLSHVPSQPALLPLFRDPGGMLSRSEGMLSRNDEPPDIWDTHGISGSVFVNPTASSSSPFPGGFNPWYPTCRNTHHRMSRVNAKHQTQLWIRDASEDRQPETHSTRRRQDFQRIMGQTNKDCRFRIFNFDKFLTQQRMLVGR